MSCVSANSSRRAGSFDSVYHTLVVILNLRSYY